MPTSLGAGCGRAEGRPKKCQPLSMVTLIMSKFSLVGAESKLVKLGTPVPPLPFRPFSARRLPCRPTRRQKTESREPEACPFFEPPFTVQTIFRPEAPMPAYPRTKNGVPLLAWREFQRSSGRFRAHHPMKRAGETPARGLSRALASSGPLIDQARPGKTKTRRRAACTRPALLRAIRADGPGGVAAGVPRDLHRTRS
jgi:hypothetical protein